jgi:hypothetical protein
VTLFLDFEGLIEWILGNDLKCFELGVRYWELGNRYWELVAR